MIDIETCKYCKHAIDSVTYSLLDGQAVSHKITCKITKKVKADFDTCKRYRYKPSILSV